MTIFLRKPLLWIVVTMTATTGACREPDETAPTRQTTSPATAGPRFNVRFFLAEEQSQPGYREATVEWQNEKLFLPSSSCLGGEDIARVELKTNSAGYAFLEFQFTEAGTKRLAKLTRENIHRRFAVVVDERVLIAPRIESPIEGGIFRLMGAASQAELESIRKAIETP